MDSSDKGGLAIILTDHQPAYLPWLGLLHKIAIADKFCYLDNVQYSKTDWTNRNKVKTPSGAVLLTVPVYTKGHFKKTILEMEINNDVPWRRKHWNTVYLSYKKSKHFNKYADFFEDVYKREWKLLTDLNLHILHFLLKELNINVSFCKASDFNFQGYKSEFILDMCKKLGADIFVFGELGKDYADINSFQKNCVKVSFQHYRHPTYPQLQGEFISHLSIIDLLFNCGSESYDILMSGNIEKTELLKIA